MPAAIVDTVSLLRGLSGTVLEIGAGRGANFGRFPAGVRWIGLEPNRRRRAELAHRAATYGYQERVLACPAEHLELPDNAVDAVVGTIALCSVRDQPAVLAEVRRVLRPGGAYVFSEHVAAPPGTWTRWRQRCWAPLSRRFDAGCDPGRDTGAAIEAAGFRNVVMSRYSRPGIYGPFIAGVAYV